ncbi:MAG: CHRD domain-containing protein [Candidatus Eremiobacteraeota bacterium]|nr:CHRD domain-containing protein [Candidatus Eremiobacteraeota bacterium]
MNVHRLSISCAAVALLATPVLAQDAMKPAAPLQSYQFSAENGSGETGTVSLAPAGKGSTTVTIAMTGAPAGAQPAHIHTGTCAKLGSVAYPLTNVVDGKSTSTVKASLADLTAGNYAVNVHKSLSDLETYVACANLAKPVTPASSPVPK